MLRVVTVFTPGTRTQHLVILRIIISKSHFGFVDAVLQLLGFSSVCVCAGLRVVVYAAAARAWSFFHAATFTRFGWKPKTSFRTGGRGPRARAHRGATFHCRRVQVLLFIFNIWSSVNRCIRRRGHVVCPADEMTFNLVGSSSAPLNAAAVVPPQRTRISCLLSVWLHLLWNETSIFFVFCPVLHI